MEIAKNELLTRCAVDGIRIEASQSKCLFHGIQRDATGADQLNNSCVCSKKRDIF